MKPMIILVFVVFVTVLFPFFVNNNVTAATIHVGLDPEYNYHTIQAGLDAARGGDTVLVHDGIYTGSGNRDIDFCGKSIRLCSQSGPANCIIDCQARSLSE